MVRDRHEAGPAIPHTLSTAPTQIHSSDPEGHAMSLAKGSLVTTYTFGTPAPVKLYAELGKGRLDINATDTDTTTVIVEGDDPERVRVEQDGDQISIIEPTRGPFSLRSRGYEVTVTIPTASQVRAKTGSTELTARGTLRAVWAQTGSGDVDLDQVTGPVQLSTGSGDLRAAVIGGELEVKSGSGDVRVGSAGDSVRVSTGSGDVRVEQAGAAVSTKSGSGDLTVDHAAGDVSFATASGDLVVKEAAAGKIDAKTASGDVRVGIPSGVPVWTDINTVTGSIRSGITGTGQPAPGQDHVELRARTVSGDIAIQEA